MVWTAVETEGHIHYSGSVTKASEWTDHEGRSKREERMEEEGKERRGGEGENELKTSQQE